MLVVGVATVALKATRPVLLGGRELPDSVTGVGAGAAAIAVRSPLPVVVIAAAAVTALARVLF